METGPLFEKNNFDIDYNNFYYEGDDLGVYVDHEKTSFKIWAPAACNVEVFIFADEASKSEEKRIQLARGEKGVWAELVSENLEGKYYLFEIDYKDYSFQIVDPYAKAVGTNSQLGYIIDLARTDPPGWEDDRRVKLKSPTDAIIYEVHVRDFSVSDESGIEMKGKYLGFTEEGSVNRSDFSTGIDHLKELGITHVHLLPVFDFASVNDIIDDDYNWGYDPYYYNVPEGSYASDPSDESRIIEFKKMVKALHDNGIGVIMDVVYNHTFFTEESSFEKIAPGYFYRTHAENELANGSGVGNEVATERPMVRKFIVDSLCYWAKEYHIDGFRFDLMRLIDKKTMDIIEDRLHDIDSSIIIYGEPWSALPPQLDHDEQMNKGAQQGMNIAAFNDHLRDTIKGDTDGVSPGFVNGSPDCVCAIKKGVVGGINYSEEIYDFTQSPEESVNYVSSHDNLSLWDKLELTNSDDPEGIRVKIDKMAQGIVFTSQGIPFIQGGEEFLRTKYGNSNSYNAGDEVNMLKWERKTKYHDTFKYYKGLIEMRKKYPAFRMKSAEDIRDNLEFIFAPENTVGFKLTTPSDVKIDKKNKLIVLYNPEREWKQFTIPEKKWGIIVDDREAGSKPFNIFTAGCVVVPPITVMVLVSME